MIIQMLETHEKAEMALREITPPNGSGIIPHRLLDADERERRIATVTAGNDTWDITLVSTAGSMQSIHGYSRMSFLYEQRLRYTDEEIAYMRSIGIEI